MEFVQRCREALEIQRQICRDPDRYATATFDDLIDQAAGSKYWSQQGVRVGMPLSEFSQRVGVCTYETYRDLVQKVEHGSERILTSSPVLGFYQTSGTTNKPKQVPATIHLREQYRGPALLAQWGLYFELCGMDSYEPGSVLDLSWDRQPAPIVEQGVVPSYSITKRPASIGGTDWTPPWYDEPYLVTPEGEGSERGQLRKMSEAMACDARVLVSVNPSRINLFVEQFHRLREKLIPLVQNCPRGPHLVKMLEASTDEKPLSGQDIWPNMKVISCWNCASAALYVKKLSQLFPDATIVPFSTTSTEGIVTLPVDNEGAGALAVNMGWYEFVPWSDMSNDRPLLPDEPTIPFNALEKGKDYRLVMSQATGLLRMDIGDAYKVTGFVGNTPRLEFIGRVGSTSSMTGEKLTESDVTTAMNDSVGDLGSEWYSWFAIFDTEQNADSYYLLIAEERDVIIGDDSSALATKIEQTLLSLQPEYKEKRLNDPVRLGPMRLLKVPDGTFSTYRRHRIENGTAESQYKHRWLNAYKGGEGPGHMYDFLSAYAEDEGIEPALSMAPRVT